MIRANHISVAESSIVGTTALFREPALLSRIRDVVISGLQGLQKPTIWHAGCSTGEEAFSMAILLEQGGLLNSRIYATDKNAERIQAAKAGAFDLALLEEYAKNYSQMELPGQLKDYLLLQEYDVCFKPAIRQAVSFFQHDLIRDSSFQLFNCIICRNVLIYYAKALRIQIFNCLNASLEPGGFLCLGRAETLQHIPGSEAFQIACPGYPIYQKLY